MEQGGKDTGQTADETRPHTTASCHRIAIQTKPHVSGETSVKWPRIARRLAAWRTQNDTPSTHPAPPRPRPHPFCRAQVSTRLISSSLAGTTADVRCCASACAPSRVAAAASSCSLLPADAPSFYILVPPASLRPTPPHCPPNYLTHPTPHPRKSLHIQPSLRPQHHDAIHHHRDPNHVTDSSFKLLQTPPSRIYLGRSP
jgi:hypothetical protein